MKLKWSECIQAHSQEEGGPRSMLLYCLLCNVYAEEAYYLPQRRNKILRCKFADSNGMLQPLSPI